MKYTKIFLSQPMSSIPDEEVIRDRKEMKRVLDEVFKDKKIEYLSTFEFSISQKVKNLRIAGVLGYEEAYNSHLIYLSNALEYMSICDYIVFHPNYKNSRGCQVEHNVAEIYKIPKIYLYTKDYDDEYGYKYAVSII